MKQEEKLKGLLSFFFFLINLIKGSGKRVLCFFSNHLTGILLFFLVDLLSHSPYIYITASAA